MIAFPTGEGKCTADFNFLQMFDISLQENMLYSYLYTTHTLHITLYFPEEIW